MSDTRIVVVGAGAIGSYFGGRLAQSGSYVTLVGRHAHVTAIATQGLTIQRIDGEERVHINATDELDCIGDADIVLVCVKAYDTEDIGNQIKARMRPTAVVLSLQNGVDNAHRLSSILGGPVMAAAVYIAVTLEAPGVVVHRGRGDLQIGFPHSMPDADLTQLRRLQLLFQRADVPCEISPDIDAALWAKLVMNCAYNALSAISGCTYGELVGDATARRVMRNIIAEAAAVARISGVHFEESTLVADAYALGEAMSQTHSSTSQDMRRGRRTEIEHLNGYVADRGREAGVETPTNELLRCLVRLRAPRVPGDASHI